MNPIFDAHFAQLRELYPEAMLEAGNPAGLVVTVPGVPTAPAGAWSKPSTTIRFVVPVGYPQAQPDCFFADRDLRLAGGVQPANSAENVQLGVPHLWFSWHVARWSPRTDTLLTFLRIVIDRLRQAR